MKKVTAVVIDSIYGFMAPAAIDIETFEVVRLASIYDTLSNFAPSSVGILVNDYKKPWRTYELKVEDGKMFIKNSQAKKALVHWSSQLNIKVAAQLLENDRAIKEKNILQTITHSQLGESKINHKL